MWGKNKESHHGWAGKFICFKDTQQWKGMATIPFKLFNPNFISETWVRLTHRRHQSERQSFGSASEPQIHFVTCQPASCGFGCPWTAILCTVTNDSYHYRLRKSPRKKINHRRSAKPRNSSQSKSLDESLELWGDIMKEAVWKWRGCYHTCKIHKYINKRSANTSSMTKLNSNGYHLWSFCAFFFQHPQQNTKCRH